MWPLLGGLSTHFALNAPDATFNSWVLAWGADRLAHGLIGFWSPPIFCPYPETLAYSENLLAIAAIVAPVQWVFDNPVLTYNVALFLSFVVAGVSTYALALELTASRLAAIVAALGFAFSPYRWAQLTHLQVLWTAWLPFVLWALHLALRTSKLSHWAMFAGAFVLQVLSNGYSAFQAAIAVSGVVVAGVLMREVNGAKVLRLIGATAIVALLLLPMALVHARVWSSTDPTPGDLKAYGADVSTYLSVAAGLPGRQWLPGLAQDEGNLFPGTVVALLALAALIPLGRSRPAPRARWTYAGIAVVAVLLSLGPEPRAWGEPLPVPPIYRWLMSAVPVFDAMRVPARFGVLAILAIDVLAACGVARVALAMPKSGRVIAGVVAGALIVLDGYSGPAAPLTVVPYSTAQSSDEAAATEWLTAQPPGALLNLPMLTLGETTDMRQQFAVLKHRHPTINGVSRMVTPLVELLSGSGSALVVPDQLPQAVAFLRGLGVRYVLLRANEFFDASIAERLASTFANDPAAHERRRFGSIAAWELDPLLDPPGLGPLTRLPREALTLTASDNSDRASFAVDGRPETRWLTAHPQDGTEWLAVDFDRPRPLARLDVIVHARSLINYPRAIEMVAVGQLSGAPEAMLFSGSVLPELGLGWRRTPDLPTISIAFPSQPVSRIIVRQRGAAAKWFWAVDELVFWERN